MRGKLSDESTVYCIVGGFVLMFVFVILWPIIGPSYTHTHTREGQQLVTPPVG